MPDAPMTSATPMSTCPYCGQLHGGTCPRVKAIEYHPNGSVKRVEFHEQRPVQDIDWQNFKIGSPHA